MITRIFHVDESCTDCEDIKISADILKDGGLVAFPTETVYGLGGDATDASAAKKIYAAKGRPSDNPLIIHIATPKDAEIYAKTNSAYYSLAEAFMPGPLTVVLESKDTVPLTTRGGLDTVAVRCPENPIARELIKKSGVAIAAPSANLSGTPSPTCFEHVYSDMNGRVDAIIDGGDCDFGLESTIVKVNSDGTLVLLRPGKITIENIEAIGLSVTVADAVVNSLKEDEIAISPGMKYKHYAPKSPLVLIDGTKEETVEYISNHAGSERVAIIAYEDDAEYISSHVENATVYTFGARNDEIKQAHLLFGLLRDTDEGNYDVIYAPLPQKNGIGLALYNRMIRAAAHKIIRL